MKNTKKLFLSVFALSAMILSACSGGSVTPDTSSTEPAPGTSSQEPAPTTSSQEPGPASSSQQPGPESSSALPPEESSSSGEESSSVEPVIPADYRVEIGNAVYDLVYNTDQTVYTEYYLGADVTKAVSAGEAISFLEYDWDHEEYDELTAAPSPDDTTGLVYNNVVLDGTDYEIRASGDVAIYLKQDLEGDWTYWITGGGAMEDPFYAGYRLAYGADDDDPTWAFDNAVVGVEAPSTEEGVAKQLKFSIEVGADAIGAKVTNGGEEWYGAGIAQPEAYHSDLLPEPNILLEAGGDYDIYFKLLTSGAHAIWVQKNEPRPSTIEHMYLFYGENQLELTRRVEPKEGWNQFYAEELQISKDTPLLGLSLVDHVPTTQEEAADINEPSAEVMALFKMVGSEMQFKYDGKYSVYLNEKVGQKFDLYLVREGGIPTVDTAFTLKTVGAIPANNDIYVAGTMNATAWSLEDAFKLTPNEGRDTWTATFKLSDGLEYDYKFVLKPADGNADWDILNPGYSGEGNNREATGGIAVNVDLNNVPTLNDGIYLVGDPFTWNTFDTTNMLTKDPEDANHYSMTIDLKSGDKFKIVVVTNGEKDWTKNNVNAGSFYDLDDNGNLVMDESGKFNIHYYVIADEDHVVVAKNIAPLYYVDLIDGDSVPQDDNSFTLFSEDAQSGFRLLDKDKVLILANNDESIANYFNVAEGVYTLKTPTDKCIYVFTVEIDENNYSLSVERQAAECCIWLKRGTNDWTAFANLVENPTAEGELQALGVNLEAGDEFVVHTYGDAYIKTLEESGAYANFGLNESGNLYVKEGKGGEYNFYVYGEELDKLAVHSAVALDYYVVTDADSWAKNETAKLAYDSVNNKYTISGFALAQNQKIKVIDSSASPEWYGNASVWDNCGFTIDGDNNLVISEAGNYTIDFYLESAQNNHIVIGKEVAPATITSLAVALHESYATQFKDRTYFIHSWKGSQNHTDFFTEAGNVEVIDGADGYLFGALKDKMTEEDGLGNEWGNVDNSAKTSDITSFPTTNVELHYADSKATAWLDGVDPASIVPDSALFTVPSNWNDETIYVYAWSGEGDDITKNGEWPGVQLSNPTTNGYNQTQYAITIGEYANFIISDGTNQTVDLLASQLAGKSGCYCSGDKDSSGHYILLFW